MIKEIKTPKQLDYLLSNQKDKRVKNRILKVYEALVYKSSQKDKDGWFYVPSKYLEKINTRYYKAIETLINHGILEVYKKTYYPGDKYGPTDLWSGGLNKESYNTKLGICKKYRFLINIEDGKEINFEIDIEDIYKDKRWYNLTKKSLIELGLEPRIKRDNFSRRLHTNITGNIAEENFKSYKDYCKGYYSIDSVTSQPRLLWIWLKEVAGLEDEKLSYIFFMDIDFYEYLAYNIESIYDRDMAKDIFTSWINGKGYIEDYGRDIKKLFPVVTMYIRNFKKDGYKNLCKVLQIEESKIWIDDLLENCPTDFALTVHDSLIVKPEDKDKVFKYCQEKYPQLKFKMEKI